MADTLGWHRRPREHAELAVQLATAEEADKALVAIEMRHLDTRTGAEQLSNLSSLFTDAAI